MTSISSVGASAAAAILQKSAMPSTSQPVAPSSPPSAPSVGSSSAAKVPSAIAGMALRGASDGDADDR